MEKLLSALNASLTKRRNNFTWDCLQTVIACSSRRIQKQHSQEELLWINWTDWVYSTNYPITTSLSLHPPLIPVVEDLMLWNFSVQELVCTGIFNIELEPSQVCASGWFSFNCFCLLWSTVSTAVVSGWLTCKQCVTVCASCNHTNTRGLQVLRHTCNLDMWWFHHVASLSVSLGWYCCLPTTNSMLVQSWFSLYTSGIWHSG